MKINAQKAFFSVLLFIPLLAVLTIGCGSGTSATSDGDGENGGGSGGGEVGSATTGSGVTLESGATGMQLEGALVYSFPKALDASTLTETTAFIMPVGAASPSIGAQFDDAALASCDPANRVPSDVACSSDTSCSVTPREELEACYQYRLCVLSTVKYADGASFPGDAIDFTTLCWADYFGGPCTYVTGSEPADDDTFTYDDMVTIFVEWMGNDASAIECLCQEAYAAGESACITIPMIGTAAEGCAIDLGDDDGDGGGEGEGEASLVHVYGCNGLELCPGEDGEESTLFSIDLESADTVLNLMVDYRADLGEDISALKYMVMAMDEERNCGGNCWFGGAELCEGLDSCSHGFTGTDIAEFLAWTVKDGASDKLAAFNSGECVDVWWEWSVQGIDPNHDPDGYESAHGLLHIRIGNGPHACSLL